MRSLRNNTAVSQIIGYTLGLTIISLAIASSILAITAVTNQRTETAASVLAKDIADRVADTIMNARIIRQEYPNANYSRIIEIPLDLIGRQYYIEVTGQAVYVNSTDRGVHETATLYNASETLCMDITGKEYGSRSKIKIYSDKTDYVYRFDFGPPNSSAPKIGGYTRITHLCSPDDPFCWDKWWKNKPLPLNNAFDWKYRTQINITNPTEEDLTDYQILVRLDPTNFDYSTVNSNGSDLRFFGNASSGEPTKLYYWIEVWNPRNTSTSRIWIKIPDIPPGGCDIYMYHGNSSASPLSNGTNVFDFFDDFSNDILDIDKWESRYGPGGEQKIIDNMLVLKNFSAVVSNNTNITNGILEVKARAVGPLVREASMFARYNTSSLLGNYIFRFLSGYFPEPKYNLAMQFITSIPLIDPLLVRHNTSLIPGAIDGGNYSYTGVDQDWNRLVFIVNDTDYVVARYDYESFMLDHYVNFTDPGTINAVDGRFGLCTLETSVEAYYDWIFLRQFAANTSEDVNTSEEQYPTAYVRGTGSQYYEWSGTNQLFSTSRNMSDDLSKDFVWGENDNTFVIKNLDNNANYSIVFTMGDKNATNTIDHVNVYVNNIQVKSDITIDPGCFEKNWFVAKPNSGSELHIKFEDADAGGPYAFWNICWLTVEKGIRSIKMTGDV